VIVVTQSHTKRHFPSENVAAGILAGLDSIRRCVHVTRTLGFLAEAHLIHQKVFDASTAKHREEEEDHNCDDHDDHCRQGLQLVFHSGKMLIHCFGSEEILQLSAHSHRRLGIWRDLWPRIPPCIRQVIFPGSRLDCCCCALVGTIEQIDHVTSHSYIAF
jgi:hypothetical protein